MENSMEIPQKTKIDLPYDTEIPLLDIYPEKNKNTNLKRYIHPNVHSSTIYNSQDTEATQVCINRQMDKDVFYICTMEHSSAIKKNEILPSAATWKDIENIMLSEISQRKTNTV